MRLFPGLLPLELQIALEDSPETHGVAHPYIGYLRDPSNTGVIRTPDFEMQFHTDAQGFRNPDPWPDEADILAVGDSLTFGYGVGVEESWPALIAQRFPEKEIVNLGLIGAGPQQYLRIHETFGVPLSPDLLLVGLFVGNDFWDAELFETWLEVGIGGNYMVWRDFGRGQDASLLSDPVEYVREFLLRRSYVYSFARYLRALVRNWQRGEPIGLQLADGSRLQLRPDDYASRIEDVQPGDPVFEIVVASLERMHEIAMQDGTQMIVVFQPAKEEVYLPLLDGRAPDPGAPLRRALEDRGIEYIDLLPVFRRQALDGAKLFFEVDGHPNAAGYRLIADEIIDHIEANASEYGLVSAEPPPPKR